MKKIKMKTIGIITGALVCLCTLGKISFAGFEANNAMLDTSEYTTIAESTTETSTTTEVSTTTTTTTDTSTKTTTSTSTSTTAETKIETVSETTMPTLALELNEPTIKTIESTKNTPQSTQEVSVSIVYKPTTHYVHKANCHWCDSTCYEINSTEGIESRKCSECNPDIEILVEYVQPSLNSGINTEDLSDWDITLLRKIISSEYGSDYVPVEEKAKIVASVMNMVKDSRWSNTIEGVLDTTCAPYGFNKYKDYYMSDSIYDAVDYYFENKDTVFADWTCNQWWGDGKWNHFHTI